MAKTVRDYAIELGVDPDLAEAVESQESRGNPTLVSPRGARGSMQVMPKTSVEISKRYGPDLQRQGVGYLGERLKSFEDVPEDQRQSFALAAYNAGPGRLERARKHAGRKGLDPNSFTQVAQFLPQETRDYVPGVFGRVKGKPGATSVQPGPGVAQVTASDPESELRALAGGSANEPATDPEAELQALAGGQDNPEGKSVV